MFLKSDSYLRNPPLMLHPKQVAAFNGLRFSLDICYISYNRLLDNLSGLADNRNIDLKIFPHVYLDLWSFINNSVIFKSILSKEFNLLDEEPYFTELTKCERLRNSNQYIEERLSQINHGNDLPLYGSLSWLKNYFDSSDVVVSSIYSGTTTDNQINRMKMSNKTNDEVGQHEIIQKIEFTGVTKEVIGKQVDFSEQIVIIDKVVEELKWWINHIEQQMHNRFDKFEQLETHTSDLIIQLKGKLVKREALHYI